MTRACWVTLSCVPLIASGAGCARGARGNERNMNESTQSAVYVAAKIRTLDAERPEAEALAVAHGRVLAVGSRREVLEAAGPEARVVELPAGAVVVPGLADAHAHLSSLGRTLTVANLKGTKSVDE